MLPLAAGSAETATDVVLGSAQGAAKLGRACAWPTANSEVRTRSWTLVQQTANSPAVGVRSRVPA
jgi:hypothetical protein